MAGFSLPSALLTGQTITQADWTAIRDCLTADAHAIFPLGGSRSIAVADGGGAKDAEGAVDFQLPSSSYSGFVFKVVVEVVTENIATTITPRLYNITDASATWTGSAGTATAFGSSAEQISTALTIATGKRYRLQFTKSDDAYDCFGIGYILRTAA